MPTINYDKLDLINIGTLKSDLVSTSAVRTNTLSAVESVTTALIYNSAGDNVSEKWDAAYSYNYNTSALILGDLTNLATNSSRWDGTWTAVYPSSANWNNTYSSYSTNSASFATISYVNSNFLSISGGSLSGSLDVGGNLTVYGTLCALSGINFNGSTVFTSSSSLSVINYGLGPALYVAQRGGPGGIATFLDNYGTVFYVGNRVGSFSLGAVGINTSTPDKALTVVGDISSTAQVYASALHVGLTEGTPLPDLLADFIGDKNTYVQVNLQNKNSGVDASSDFVITADNGNDTDHFLNLGLGSSNYGWTGNTVTGPNDGYLYVNKGDLSIGVDNGYDLRFFTNGLTGGLSASNVKMVVKAGGNVGIGVTNPNALLTVGGVLSTNNIIIAVDGSSTNWNSAWNYSNSTSASVLGGLTNIADSSAGWDSAYTFTNSNSSLILGDLTVVATNSASWGSGGAGNAVLAANSGRWDSAWSFSSGNSALILGDLSNIAVTSATWDSAYSYTNTNSANIVLQNSSPTFNNATITGNLSVLGDLTYLDTTVTVTSALSVVNLGSGPALTIKQAGAQPIATFIDSEGGYITFADTGAVGIGTQTPYKKLTIIGDVSATGVFYTTASNSDNWSAAYTNVNANSASWTPGVGNNGGTLFAINSALIFGDLTNLANTSANWNTSYTFLTANTALILGDLTNIAVTSANWNTSYTFLTANSSLILGDLTNIAVTSAYWNESYSFNNSTSALILGDLTVVATNSAFWNPGVGVNGGVLFAANSALIFGDLTNIATTSSTWNTAYTNLIANSAAYLSGVNVDNLAAVSANWNTSYTFLTANTALILGDLTDVATNSAKWNSAYSFSNSNSALILGDLTVVATNSASWGLGGSGSSVYAINSAKYETSYSFLTANSALILGDLTDIANTSANWNSAYSFASSNSALILGDLSNIAVTSAYWNTSYTFLTANTALILGDLSNIAVTSATWDSAYTFTNSNSALILGDLTVVATNSAFWNPGVGTNGGTLFALNSAMIFGNLTDVNITSANWNNSYTNLVNNSAAYLSSVDLSNLAAVSSNWNTSYTFLTANTALILGDLTNISVTSGNWNESYTFTNSNSSLILGDLTVVATNSAFWGSGGGGGTGGTLFALNSAMIFGDLTNINVTSANWDSAYSYTNTNSANIVLQNSSPTLSGLTVLGNLSVLGDLTYLDTIVTVTSALSVVNTGTGPALTIKQFGTQPVATFIDAEGGYMTIADTGSVGIGTQLPNEKLSVVGNISATGKIYAGIGNSDEWNSSYTFNNSTSSLILGDLTVVATNSATWGGGGAGYTWANTNSALILGDLTNISQNSAKWDSAYSFSNSNSALILGDLTNIAVTSANWNTSYTFNNSTSSLILGDLTVVATNSANWGTGSAGYSWANANSALILGDLTNIANTSAKWDTAYSYSNSTSALILGDLTNIAVTSGNWNKSYTYFTWLTANSGSGSSTNGGNYIPLSGTGGGAIYGPLSSTSSASFSALALSGGFTTLNGTVSTFTNAMTASNDFLLITVNGRTRGIRLYDF